MTVLNMETGQQGIFRLLLSVEYFELHFAHPLILCVISNYTQCTCYFVFDTSNYTYVPVISYLIFRIAIMPLLFLFHSSNYTTCPFCFKTSNTLYLLLNTVKYFQFQKYLKYWGDESPSQTSIVPSLSIYLRNDVENRALISCNIRWGSNPVHRIDFYRRFSVMVEVPTSKHHPTRALKWRYSHTRFRIQNSIRMSGLIHVPAVLSGTYWIGVLVVSWTCLDVAKTRSSALNRNRTPTIMPGTLLKSPDLYHPPSPTAAICTFVCVPFVSPMYWIGPPWVLVAGRRSQRGEPDRHKLLAQRKSVISNLPASIRNKDWE